MQKTLENQGFLHFVCLKSPLLYQLSYAFFILCQNKPIIRLCLFSFYSTTPLSPGVIFRYRSSRFHEESVY